MRVVILVQTKCPVLPAVSCENKMPDDHTLIGHTTQIPTTGLLTDPDPNVQGLSHLLQAKSGTKDEVSVLKKA